VGRSRSRSAIFSSCRRFLLATNFDARCRSERSSSPWSGRRASLNQRPIVEHDPTWGEADLDSLFFFVPFVFLLTKNFDTRDARRRSEHSSLTTRD